MLTATYRYTSPSGEVVDDAARQLLVLDLLEPATAGVGYSSQTTVLCMWLDSPSSGQIAGVHHLSFPVDLFAELVAEGEEPPEYADLLAQQAGRV
ncbi:hypothetical protein [Streptomyces malaysiensis]|uniref:Uncharacterized protein n=1 Tax=Streptomyces malaysiensis TaxID=92644 RepID=A0A7X5X7N0_STRMQ|nr:hypothetical protein [Streptomyces malaysiensis]NIY68052.1 hypothetical protein [Streptomyces malaysiensis]